MKREPEVIGRRSAVHGVRDAYRGHVTRAVAVGDLILVALEHGRRRVCLVCLAESGCCGSQGKTPGQRGAALQKFPSSRSFRSHVSLLRRWVNEESPAEGESIRRNEGWGCDDRA